MRVVIDTNVLISASYFGGKPQQAIQTIKEQAIDFFTSKEIQNEYKEVFMRMNQKGFHPNKEAQNILNYTIRSSITIETIKSHIQCRDPKDNKFIDCALSANADFIITGDNDLLVLKQIESTKIVTVDEFLTLFIKNN